MLNPNTIYYSQELRSYAMLLGLSSVFIILCYIIYKAINDEIINNQTTITIYLIILGIALVLTHYYAYIFVLSVGVVLLAISLYKQKL